MIDSITADTDLLLAALPDTARMADVRTGAELDAAGVRGAVADRAAKLHVLGLRHGDRVVVGEADPLAAVLGVFAAWEAGLAAVVVNPTLMAPEQQTVLEASGARAWLGAFHAVLPEPAVSAIASYPLEPDEPALILMTSGTTGRPKGIAHSQRTLRRRIAHNLAAVGPDALRESLCVLPVFFGHGLIGNGLTPLFAGGRVHFWPTPTVADLTQLGSIIDARGITFMSSVPSFWKLALRLSPKPARPLERIHVGSAPLGIGQWRDIAQWGGTASVFNMFGMTETANWIGGGALAEAQGRDGYVGKLWGGAVAVRRDSGEIARSGRGEVLLKSPSIMLGYWQRPDLDAQAFVDRWFRTGDIGELEADGQLTLVGRIKTEINRGGIKVQAEEIDMLLERHPDILEACAFGIPDAAAGEAVAAAVVLRAGTAFDPEAIKAWCRANARADAVPSKLFATPAIPRNDRGKIVRADVRRLVEAGS